MRIAIFTETFAPQVNGVARTLKRLTDTLQRRGVEHLVFAPTHAGNGADDSNWMRPVGSIPFFLYPECRLAMPNTIAMRAELDRFKPDLIHLATPFNVGLCGLRYARKRGVPHVASYHTHFDRYLSYYHMSLAVPMYWKYIRWFHRTCSATFAPSLETIRTLREQQLSGMRLWSRGVDCRLFAPVKRDSAGVRSEYAIDAPLLLLYVGRIAPEKDIDTLLAVMQSIASGAMRHSVHWLVVGDGPMLPDMRAKAPANVTFTGYKSGEELARLYASADVFVSSSSTETFGNVVLEAMASGVPVVGADAGGVRETVSAGITGQLCAPLDAGAFESAIRRLAEHADVRAAYGAEARQAALGRSWDAVFDRLLADYAAIAAGKTAGADPHSA
ncbi:MAG: glycosyltransferase family 1 protein [Paenibacillaceae bacterium]|nr:glycosyltransferase family 1 protein [Paenibacillaceae bacterium]